MPDLYIKDSQLSVDEVIKKLKEAVPNNKFGILHSYDIKQTLAGKGQELTEACHVFEICNPVVAKNILEKDMNLATVLPCRVSVYTQGGVTKVGMALPSKHIAQLSSADDLSAITGPVEQALINIVDQSIT
ncbi:MAG: DUF302 domain-containing protein [Proteobacteria bacterium]|nr:DUF302 domain-containing protein [Pseudomonadota bacterium]MCH9712330.1 DUF302 domain-containing protein [Pseudomonadota bacterium]MCH9750446.1 DUF302 domain-containing protein [Pseudomonadota bacterium]